MNRVLRALILLAGLSLATEPASAQSTTATQHADGTVTIENPFLKRTFATTNNHLNTTHILNKRDSNTLTVQNKTEFQLRISQGTDLAEGDATLSSRDFTLERTRAGSNKSGDHATASFLLTGKTVPLTVRIDFTLNDADFYLRKTLTLINTGTQPITLERIDVESLEIPGAYQPYKTRAITAQGAANWKPGLGQPLYTTSSGSFWGIEFPAAYNYVENEQLHCGYLHGRPLPPRQSYTSYPAIVGVSDHPAFVKDAFFEYINRIRIRPLRLQIQYNSWFDHGSGVNRDKFNKSMAHIHKNLVTDRGLPPLSAYVIDDGWQNTGADWSQKVFQTNSKFDENFSRSRNAASRANSSLGIWLSPGCLFGSQGAIGKMKDAGFEAIAPWMSMAGPKYMAKLEERMVELTRLGITYFKLDGLFGHYITRNFELNGQSYGLPSIPHLVPEGMQGNDPRLNDPKFDELKTYYLVAGTERLIKVFQNMATANPQVYIVISNGAYLSPWWLQHVDSVWMINAGDAAGGSTRTEELVYRDGRYYELWEKEQTQFPLCALFNHEPKKTSSKETKDTFRRYLYMNTSRGTGFIELYIKPFALQDYDWDVLAEGLHWAHAVFPTFSRSLMHGGNPEQNEVYGFTAWNTNQGYVSIHNPSDEERRYQFTLNRAFGLHLHTEQAGQPLFLSSPIQGSTNGLPPQVPYGTQLSVTLKPHEIRILNFTSTPRDWKTLKQLQQRTPRDYVAPKPIPILNHPVIGTWIYSHNGISHTRTFSTNGTCTLRSGTEVQWTMPFEVNSPTEITVGGSYPHLIRPDGTMDIENAYHAQRKP